MSTLESINLGIVGIRRGAFAFAPVEGMRLHAVCDTHAEKLDAVTATHPRVERWTDFDEMLQSSSLDAVLIATPMPLHASQSIAALWRGLHVLSEVPAAVSIDECRQLVQACHQSRGLYMMAENVNYFRSVRVITEMVRRGVFGETYFAEGEYLHPLHELFTATPWRRQWQVGINGITYGTHSLGPLLAWMPGDRVTSVTCAGSGHRHVDASGKPFEMEASCVMLAKTARGSLIKIRQDFISSRPGAHKFALQGTDGAFETDNIEASSRIWLRSRSHGLQWMPLADLEDEYLPDAWKRHSIRAADTGHGGSDYMQLVDFAEAIQHGRPSPIGIHEAMDMTVPGLCSQISIAQGMRWVDVPDSRNW
jgi:predicted dehydrogenase